MLSQYGDPFRVEGIKETQFVTKLSIVHGNWRCFVTVEDLWVSIPVLIFGRSGDTAEHKATLLSILLPLSVVSNFSEVEWLAMALFSSSFWLELPGLYIPGIRKKVVE